MAPLIVPLVKIALLIVGLMTAAAYLVLLERWMAAWVQDRRGPNRVGIPLTKIKLFGLGQPLADGLKFIFKEEYTPGARRQGAVHSGADRRSWRPRWPSSRSIPFGSVLPPLDIARHGRSRFELVVAPGVDVGMIYVFALSSIAVYGVILGGWASNNKYSFLGGLRSSAQLIAYEIAAGPGHSGRGAGRPARCGWTTIIAPAGRKRRVERVRAAAGLHRVRDRGRLPRRPGCRSICPRPSRNWSAAITPNTPA